MNAPANIPVVISTVESRLSSYAKVLPAHIRPEAFLSAFKTMAMNNPDVLNATPRSVAISVMQAAQDGLMPDGKDAAIVVRNSIATYQRMSGGLIKLLHRTNKVRSITLAVVRDGDVFNYALGDEPFIQHQPKLSIDGDIIAAYSVVTFTDGSKDRCLMSRDEIDRIMRISKQGWDAQRKVPKGIWAQHPAEMAKKTVLHRHIKTLPLEGMPTTEALDEVGEVEDAAWLEPEDFTSQPDSGRPTSRIERREEPEIEELAKDAQTVASKPITPEVIDETMTAMQYWVTEIEALKGDLEPLTTMGELEDAFNAWDSQHDEQPEAVQSRVKAVVEEHVNRVKNALKPQDYKQAKGD